MGFVVIAGPNSVIRSDDTPATLIVMLSIFLCGGGLWGLGIARLMNSDAGSIAKACALSWSATVFSFLIVVILLGSYFGGFSKINIVPRSFHSLHYKFLLTFVRIVGVITTINAYVVTGKLGLKELRKSVGMYTGLAAALGFLAMGLILFFGFGWEVGYPIVGKTGMLKIMLFCNFGTMLSGGATLGWLLSRIKSTGEKM